MIDNFDHHSRSGFSGCVWANRLSANGKNSVCILEAGLPDWNHLHILLYFIKTLINPNVNWLLKLNLVGEQTEELLIFQEVKH